MTRTKAQPQNQKSAGPAWRTAAVASLSLVLLCIVTFGNSLSGGFVWDDEVQVVKNPAIRALVNIPGAFLHSFWGFLAPNEQSRTNFYRPLQTVVYTLGYWWAPLSPVPDHLISLGFHIAACLFLYGICMQLSFSRTISWIAAAIFAVHPVHTEAVAWIAAVPDVACGAFYLAALWAFLKYRSQPKAVWILLSSLLYLAALFSKEMAITFPLLILFLTFLPDLRLPKLRDKAIALLSYAAVTIPYLTLRVHALGFLATSRTPAQAGWLDWITLGILALGEYIWYSVIPFPLVAFHLIALPLASRLGSTMLAAVLVGLVATMAWRLRHKFPRLPIWLAAFAILLIPVFYFKGISSAFLAERYLYIPSAAAVLAAATVLSRLSARTAWYVGSSVIAIFAIMSIGRNQDWSSDESLYTADLRTDPDIAHFQINLASILLSCKDDAGARRRFNEAERSLANPAYMQLGDDPYRAEVGLGALDARAHNYTRARQHFERALQIYPQGDWGYLYLGGIYMEQDNDYPKAIEYFEKAIRLNVMNEVARDYLGIAMLNQGNYKEAAEDFRQALEINPTDEDARQHLALATQKMSH